MNKNLLLVFLLAISTLGYGNEGRFYIKNGTIYDPEGKVFVPKGVNIQGMKWVWPDDPAEHAEIISKTWKFNLVRVNCKLYDGYWNGQNVSANAHYQTIESMSALVDAFTSKQVVVMFEFHDNTGGYYTGSALADLKDAWRDVIDLYGKNPYVWFNIMNEPGNLQTSIQDWVDTHQEVIKVIRDEKSADNIIVIDGHYWGQDLGTWDTKPVNESKSSILSAGNSLLDFNDKTYQNIMFSIHIYDQWNVGSQEQIESKLDDYFTKAKEKGLVLMVGEVGTGQSSGDLYFPAAFRATFNIAPKHQVGLVWWHWFGGDNLKLTTTGNGNGALVDSDSNPTNLTWPGQIVWDYTHGNQVSTIKNTVSKNIQMVLHQNSPNPVGNTTTISYELNEQGVVELAIYNIQGKKIETLEKSNKAPGVHQLTFTPGYLYRPGIYYYTLNQGRKKITKTLIIKK